MLGEFVVLVALSHVPRYIWMLMFGTILLEDICRKKSLKSRLKLQEFSVILFWLEVCIELISNVFSLLYQTFFFIFVMLILSNIHQLLSNASFFNGQMTLLISIFYCLIDNALVWSDFRVHIHNFMLCCFKYLIKTTCLTFFLTISLVLYNYENDESQS